jgi:hypothetical protein
MRLYLDEDCASQHLVRVLTQAGHDVESPRDAQLLGKPDPVHLIHGIQGQRILVSRNHDDFELLHHLILQSGRGHPGILAIRKDNSPRDMSPSQIAAAIGKLSAAGIVIESAFIILNHWR